MATVSIKVGDNARSIEDTLTLGGSAIDLTGATLVLLWQPHNGRQTSKTATIVTATSGEVKYTFTSADVEYPGKVEFAWQITFSDSSKLTVPGPSDGPHTLVIEPVL